MITSVSSFLFKGFGVSEMCKLVSMVHRGGGSRYKSFNDKLTHSSWISFRDASRDSFKQKAYL